MKKAVWVLVLLGLVVAALTNPSEDDHREAVKNAYQELVDKELDKSELPTLKRLARAAAEIIAPEILNSFVKRTNCFVFSITQVKKEGEFKPAGIGIFGQVIFFGKPEELLKRNR